MKTLSTDRKIFEDAYLTAVDTHSKTSLDFKSYLNKMTHGEIEEIINYMNASAKSKANKVCRINHIIEMIGAFSSMKQVQEKLTGAMDMFKEMMLDNITDTFSSDDGETINITLLGESLNYIKGIKEGKADGEMQG